MSEMGPGFRRDDKKLTADDKGRERRAFTSVFRILAVNHNHFAKTVSASRAQ